LASLLLMHPKNARQEILAERATSAADIIEGTEASGYSQCCQFSRKKNCFWMEATTKYTAS